MGEVFFLTVTFDISLKEKNRILIYEMKKKFRVKIFYDFTDGLTD